MLLCLPTFSSSARAPGPPQQNLGEIRNPTSGHLVTTGHRLFHWMSSSLLGSQVELGELSKCPRCQNQRVVQCIMALCRRLAVLTACNESGLTNVASCHTMESNQYSLMPYHGVVLPTAAWARSSARSSSAFSTYSWQPQHLESQHYFSCL